MQTKRERAFENDGLLHYYSTCPACHNVVSDENIVFVDGVKMCRACMLNKHPAKPEGDRS